MPPPIAGLTSVEKFISKHYLKQPPWVRTFTFLLFVALFAYGMVATIGGRHVIDGRILVSRPNPRSLETKVPGKNYEVKLGVMYFGTNSRGQYQIVIDTLGYAHVLAVGKVEVSVLSGDVDYGRREVLLDRTQSLLDDIVMTDTAAAEGGTLLPHRSFPASAPAFSAWAASAAPRARLAVHQILLASGSPDVSNVNIDLQLGGQSSKLQATRTDSASGPVPVIRGQPILFGKDYFFPFPADGSGAGATIHISASTGIFSSYTENFPLPARIEPGQPVNLPGQRGSQIEVILTYPYNITLFDKGDIAGRKGPLAESLLRHGFLLREVAPPLGPGSQTNAIWSGTGVPLNAIESVLKAVNEASIVIKKILYHYTFASKDDPNLIQIGGAATCDSSPPIAPATLKTISEAPSEEEFMRLIQPYVACGAPPNVGKRGAGNPVKRQ